MLAAIAAWFASEGVGLVLGALAKLALDAFAAWRADQTTRAAGRADATSTINRESADAERRANEVSVNRPDLGAVLAGMERGDF
ncbi:MAG: hypothetical protein ACOY6K_10015 [Pseudomonadota bacterium]